ncbi:MAG TPA: AbrB/MazE/SpoVT family DNA-binding domain-containing protein [Desulfobacterales bacterium]|jgi:AbrB family looped-hinge helix DNA binding protein|nr:AbrB/MazE/SpoVT family DNA-binding domain-containing protein [Desulfobacterales bacterium]
MKIGERGQVTIPKDIREKYGLVHQIEVDFVPKKTGVLIRKKTHHVSPVEQVYGILRKSARTDPYIESIRGR